MARIENVTPEWEEPIHEWIPVIRVSGAIDRLNRIVIGTPKRFGLGQYISYDKDIYLLDHWDGTWERAKTLLHEVGHHVHFEMVIGDSNEFETKHEWITHCNTVTEEKGLTYRGNEIVAETFAKLALGKEVSEMAVRQYLSNDGPLVRGLTPLDAFDGFEIDDHIYEPRVIA